MDFTGKIALITGGGNGIGRAAALAFAKRGAKVVVVDKDGAAAKGTADTILQQKGDALPVTADVAKSADVQAYVKAALDKYGRIDCFFNNAGIEGKVAPIVDYDEAMFDAVIGINLKGVAPAGKLEASGTWNGMVSHRVRVESAAEFNKEIMLWLKQAYDHAG